jgi:hypothetical protein
MPMAYDPGDALVNLGAVCLLATILCFMYWRTQSDVPQKVTMYPAMMAAALTSCMVVMCFWNAMWMPLALVGTLGLVRFRVLIRDLRDQFYLYASIAAGIACSTGQLWFALAGFAVIVLVLVVLHLLQYKDEQPQYMLTFSVSSPAHAEAFLLAGASVFSEVTLRSTGEIRPGCYQYVYRVRPRTMSVEDAVVLLRKEVAGISGMSLVKPEPYTDI